jgi:transcription termination factor Rho
MAVLDRTALEESPLADLHVIARELGIDGFRRLRKAALVDAIVERQGGAASVADAPDAVAEEAPKRRTRTRRRKTDDDAPEAAEPVAEAPVAETEVEVAAAAIAEEEGTTDEDAGEERPARRSRSRRSRGGAGARDADTADETASTRSRGGRGPGRDDDVETEAEAEAAAASRSRRSRGSRDRDEDTETEPTRSRRSRGGRDNGGRDAGGRDAGGRDAGGRDAGGRDAGGRESGGRESGGRDRDRDEDDSRDSGPEKIADGTVELLGNGSGFLRVSPPDPSDDDVYISAAQVRRCELVSGDKVAGPVRSPRRSERYPSLVRIDTINGRSADEVTEGTPFDDLAAAFPTQRFALGTDDATLKAIEWLTPLGRGSRVTITGAARAGKTEALKRLAVALSAQEELEVSVVLAGARPEEIGEWKSGELEPVAALSLAASADAQAGAIERAVDTGKRIAARGGNAVVLIDSLTSLPVTAARRTLAAARDIPEGGSLTIIATADEPVGGETTVIALDVTLTSTGRFPALDLVVSGTLRPELLVGAAGADAIAQARAAALG